MLRGSVCTSGLRGDDARRLHLAKDVDDAASTVLGRLASILERQLPKLHGHLASCGCMELLFCYPCVGCPQCSYCLCRVGLFGRLSQNELEQSFDLTPRACRVRTAG
jgi:hypothetical protein